jgi:hypothetical protein
MAKLSERNQRLQELAITDSLLTTWKGMTHEEATWRNNHEYKMHCKWAKERRDFIQAELDELLPKNERPEPPPNTPPIVSHRVGRGAKTNTQTYGEKFG